ncbi:MAG: phosphate ABC transporter substrate-binding protein PstS [Methylotenera sp.]|uniref:phosphate ABC transporter substrate-binding protein PstS n=1 Tax=Methylotenera sp. TaxID=2051956 RepID=UPI0024883427|nr:phosphate ABC transporter substrate-binding protein PstS [Methylotenera sp.]MDI1308299.1 phosphate ABC transporter substrate-binding protein PstS [Methylotenera sp.]
MQVNNFNLKAALLAAGLILAPSAFATDITGAGATFPYPIYAKWAESYNVKTGVKLNYQSIGSGGGIKQITNKTVDFGASDKPLKPEELDKAGLMQFPAIVGGVVPVVNVPGVADGEMRLNGEVLANIYLKKIVKWNDPAIKALNPSLALPDSAITVVHRSDGSGTSFVFTNYLSKVSKEWSDKVGADTSVAWPTGLGGKGNEGVASYAQRIKGSIGYVEYAFAKQNKLPTISLQNRDGEFVEPSIESFQSAAKYAEWEKAPGFYEILTNEPGKTTWPITGASFILMHKLQDKPVNATEVLKFFDWSFSNGALMAKGLDYVPMPDNVVKLIETSWKTNMKSKDGAAVWTK